jgi:hypothetical protein
MSLEEVEQTARLVVGRDEPAKDSSYEQAEADHWAYLAGILAKAGVVVDPLELRGLPHEVVLSERLWVRVRRERRDA